MAMRVHPYCLFIFILFTFSCKHKEKQVVSHRPAAKKSTASKTPKAPAAGVYEVMNRTVGLSKREIGNSELYSFVSAWYGAPYRYSGCERSGVDCSCFSNILYEQVYHKKIPRTAAEMYSICRKKSLDDAREGDLLFFKIGGNIISHVGIMLRRGYFVHSSTSRGVVISSMSEAYYKKYFFCAGEIRSS
jgi:murein DD-endopeptidase / murein LD-carboxypeptidase